MTVTNQTTYTSPQFTPNGVTTTFPFDFKIMDTSQIEVVGVLNGEEFVVSSALYDVTIDTDDGGSVVFTTAPVASAYDGLYLRSNPSFVQDTSWANNTPFDAREAEHALDLAAARDLWLKRETARSLKFPVGETATTTLPPAATRALKALIFGADGSVGVGELMSTGAAIFGALGLALAATADAEEAQTVMGMYEGKANVMDPQYAGGAVGDGVTDDSAAIQAAMDSGLGEVIFPAGPNGRTFLVGTPLQQNYGYQRLRGIGAKGGVKIKWDTSVVYAGSMIYSPEHGCCGENLTLIGGGENGQVFGTVPNPGGLWFMGDTDVPVEDVSLKDMRFRGAENSFSIWASAECNLNNVSVRNPYRWGATIPYAKRLVVSGFRARGCGVSEGMKFGAGESLQPTEMVLLNNILIEDCGKLNPSTADHQEGLDLFLSDGAYIVGSNIIIRGCGNGCIEIKTPYNTHVGATNVLEEIAFSNLSLSVSTGNQPAIVVSWAVADPGEPDNVAVPATKMRRIKFTDVRCTHDPVATDTAGCMFQILASSDVEIVNPTCYGAHTFMRTAGTGGSDATVHRLSVTGGKIRPTTYGIFHNDGTLAGLKLDGVDIECEVKGLILGGGTNPALVTGLKIVGGSRIVTTGTTSNDSALDLRGVSGVEIGDCYLESEGRTITENVVAGVANVGGSIIGATLKGRAAGCWPLLVREGTWVYQNNTLLIPSAARGWVNFATGTVLAYNNQRLAQTATPSLEGGALGDVIPIANVAAGGSPRYYCASAADTSAGWKAEAAIAA